MTPKSASQAGALAKGALAVYLQPKLAADAKIDLAPIVSGVTSQNFMSQVPAIVLGVMRATKGKLAQDADIEDVAEVIEALAEILPPEQEADVKEAVEGAEGGEVNDDEDDSELRAMLKAKGLSDEEIDRICAMGATAEDAKDDDKKDDKAMDAAMVQARIREATKGMVPKTAMDSAIAAAEARAEARAVERTTAHLNSIAEARARVAPYVGEIKMALDSAEAIERQACEMLNIQHKGKHADALMTMIEAKGTATERNRPAAPRVAQDAAAMTGFNARYPNAARIGHAA